MIWPPSLETLSFTKELLLLGACATLACGARASRRQAAEPADLMLVGGNVITMTDATHVTSVAVRHGRIVAVGTGDELAPLRGPATRVIDVGGKTVVPGLIDAHMHFSRLGTRLRTLFLDEAKSAQEVVAIAEEQVRKTPKGHWITGRGWHTVGWPGQEYPDHRALSAASPDHPVYLAGMANHAAWVNQRALEIAGIDKDTPDPKDGRILRDPTTGEPTGILLEGAKDLVFRHVPKPSHEQMKADIEQGVRAAARLGLTSVHDAGVGDDEIAIYRELLAEGKLDVRLYVMRYVPTPGPALEQAIAEPPTIGERLTIRAIKAYADGALGARGAALLAPYSDRPDQTGILDNDRDALYQIVSAASKAGYQVAVHAIGDRGNRNVLDTIERVQEELGKPLRARIEHAQVIAPEDIPRLGKLGVIAAMQPIHAVMDMGFAEDRLGAQRLKGAYAWRSLRDTGAKIVGGADTPAFPVHYTNPMWGLHAFVNRQDQHGQPAGGWIPSQRLTRLEALRAYTIDAAYAAFEENDKGTIEPGKLADFTILSDDLLTMPAEEILNTRVAMTIVGGKVVYEAEPSGGFAADGAAARL